MINYAQFLEGGKAQVNKPYKFISLDSEQTFQLEQLMKNDSSARARMRAHAILLSSRGFSITEIATVFQVKFDTVSVWLDAWQQYGLSGLYDDPRSGAPQKLTDDELEIVRKLIEEHPRSSRTILAKLTDAIGKKISLSTLKRIIKKLGFRWKRMRKSLKAKQDEMEYEKAKHEIQYLKDEQQLGRIDLLYFDEAGFNLVPSVPYGYQKKGETIEIPSSSSKRINVAGFYNTATNELESFHFECNIDSKIVIACFEELSKTINKDTVVIMDNASVHRNIGFESKLPEWEAKGLFVKFLPPYCPELNLIEILWRFIKYHWLSVSAYLSFGNLVSRLEYILKNVGKEFVINFV
jgi:transposase